MSTVVPIDLTDEIAVRRYLTELNSRIESIQTGEGDTDLTEINNELNRLALLISAMQTILDTLVDDGELSIPDITYTEFAYSNEETIASTGGSYNGSVMTYPVNWYDTPSEVPDPNAIVYQSSSTWAFDMTTGIWSLYSEWSTPVRWNGLPARWIEFAYSNLSVEPLDTEGSFDGTTFTYPTDWYDNPGDVPAQASPIYMSKSTWLPQEDGTWLIDLNGWSTVSRWDGTNGVDGEDGTNGTDGARGTAIQFYTVSSSYYTDGATMSSIDVANLWNLATSGTIYSTEIEGDQIIISQTLDYPNFPAIYTYNGSSWQYSTKLYINGDAIITGTLAADRITTTGGTGFDMDAAGGAGPDNDAHIYGATMKGGSLYLDETQTADGYTAVLHTISLGTYNAVFESGGSGNSVLAVGAPSTGNAVVDIRKAFGDGWALHVAPILGGTANVYFEDDLTVDGNVTIGGNLTVSGNVTLTGLPTTDPGVTGRLWNNSGVLNISS
jgi:hypothetical protein